MPEQARGIAAVVLACVIWGLSPLFYKLLVHLDALQVLAHRALWSVLFFAGVLALRGRLGEVRAALKGWQAARLAVSMVMVAANWGLFIFATQIDRVTETSLGYFILPLVSVLIGRFWFGETMDRLQWAAVALAASGVAVLTVGLGVAPWISLVLALTFGVYSGIKKTMPIGPLVSVTCETLMFMPITFVLLTGVVGPGYDWPGMRDLLLLMLSGPLTGLPLILFSYAARRASLTTVGVVQYVNPTLQFLCATVIFGELFTSYHAVAFTAIWLALGLYSWALIAQEKAARRRARAGSTPSTNSTSPNSDGSANP